MCCVGSFKTIDNSCCQVCVPSKVKNINVKVFNSMSGINEIEHLFQHELCGCKCGLSEGISNWKQKWNHNENSCDCKEWDGWIFCQDDYIWNPSTCDCK